MLTIKNQRVFQDCAGISRRDFVRVGALGMLCLTLAGWYKLEALGQTKKTPKAKSVIQLWMAGGPTHTDTWDPKPQSGDDYTGPYKKPIETNVSGIRIGEKFPLLAKQADKYSIIRGMTHGIQSHETATYAIQTGTVPSAGLVYPSIGAVVSLKKGYDAGYQGSLPPYIAVTNPLGRFSEAGFLGARYKAFATGGDPNAKTFNVQGLVPSRGIPQNRLEGRRSLLKEVDTLAKQMENNREFETMDSFQDKAYGLMLGEAKKAFDINDEPEELRKRYGRNRFGQSCLLARRLVERGVPFITVNYGGWDTHKQHFEKMDKMLPVVDSGFATLLDDLSQRGLLDSTIVVWYGEFGRTPKIAKESPWNGGRHHFGHAFSCVVAGGGFKGGSVVGATDAKGETVRDRPVYPWDLSASMYDLMGIDPNGTLPHPHGCVAYVSPIAGGDVQSGGILSEIM